MTTEPRVKAGQTVEFLPQWRDAGDEDITYIALSDEDGGRVLVEAQVDMTIKPTQVVDVSMIRLEFTE